MKIDWMELKPQIKKHTGFNLLVLLCGLLALLFLVLTVVAVFSTQLGHNSCHTDPLPTATLPLFS